MTDTKLYCLVTEARVCEQLAQGRYLTAARPGIELATSQANALTITPAGHRLSVRSVENGRTGTKISNRYLPCYQTNHQHFQLMI